MTSSTSASSPPFAGRWPVLGGLALAGTLYVWPPSRDIAAGLATLTWLGLCVGTWRHHRQRNRQAPLDSATLPIAYASQGGQAQALAERSAAQLCAAGRPARALPLNALSPAALERVPLLLLVASTQGDGEAPDNAARFERQLMDEHPDLARLDYALLALGDLRYPDFCGFARRLDRRLRELGARPLHDRLEADRVAPDVLRHWQRQLGRLAGDSTFTDWQPAPYRHWRLVQRRQLNPGSAGLPVFHLRLHPLEAPADWQAGDIAEIGPRLPAATVQAFLDRLGLDGTQALGDGRPLAWHLAGRLLPERWEALAGLAAAPLLERLPTLPHREYSIASVMADGTLDLLVREVRYPDGRPGLGSGWLCRHAALQEPIDLRIRSNPGFRLPADSGPLILVGSGTGLAGLRAHLRERERLGQSGHWLLFGERQAAHDRPFAEELEHWQRSGHLARLDLVYSRDGGEHRYVQDRLRDEADRLRDWVARGASILVCGSLDGMGQAVDALLHGVLGRATLERLIESGRYRRDLY